MGQEGDHDLLIEAGVDADQVVERAREQQRADQQDQRQGDLRDDQHAAQAKALAAHR